MAGGSGGAGAGGSPGSSPVGGGGWQQPQPSLAGALPLKHLGRFMSSTFGVSLLHQHLLGALEKVSVVAPRTPKRSSFTAVLAHHHHLPCLCLGRTILQASSHVFHTFCGVKGVSGGKTSLCHHGRASHAIYGEDSLFCQPKTKVSLRGRMWEAFGRGRVQSCVSLTPAETFLPSMGHL